MQIYEHVEEANTRLHGSLFLYKGEPVFCDSVYTREEDQELALKLVSYPRARELIYVPLSDPELEFHRFNIGYVNLQYGASYATRIPARGRYKQGLCKDNMTFTTYSSDYERPTFDRTCKTPGFRDMLVNKYPSFAEAVERINLDDGPSSVAFDKQFAVSRDAFRKDYILSYKGEKIGFGADAFQVPSEFEHLRQVIQKSGIKIR